MTSIADPRRAGAHPSWVRTALIVALLALSAANSPDPWARLWLVVPAAVATALLASWRLGGWGVLVPVALFAAAVALGGTQSLWVWWVPAAALTGVWMGLREESGGGAGDRAWMLLPLLLLAVVLPAMLKYPELIRNLERDLEAGDREFIEMMRSLGSHGDQLATMQRMVEDNAKFRPQALPNLLPTALFVWMALLVAAGRALAGRAAGVLRWPGLSRTSFREWRLPDGVLWMFLAGLGLLVLQWSTATPAAWTLLLNAGLGYCIQGIAVVESLLLARGVPPSVILVTMGFVFTLAMPVFMLTTVAVGLSDVWLDYRRIEAPPDIEST